jgi:hypothetical protein
MPDYSKAVVYVLKNSANDKEFIGATVTSLSNCMVVTRRKFKKSVDKTKKLHTAFTEIGVENFRIEKLEDFPCSSLKELNLRLRDLILERDSIEKGYNDVLPVLTRKERYSIRCESDPSYYASEKLRKRESFSIKYNDPEFRRKKLEYHKNLLKTSEKYREASSERGRRFRQRKKQATEQLPDSTTLLEARDPTCSSG